MDAGYDTAIDRPYGSKAMEAAVSTTRVLAIDLGKYKSVAEYTAG